MKNDAPCVLCDMAFDTHAKGTKCLFGPTSFETFAKHWESLTYKEKRIKKGHTPIGYTCHRCDGYNKEQVAGSYTCAKLWPNEKRRYICWHCATPNWITITKMAT